MSIYANLDTDEQVQFASNKGWSDVIAWVDGLDKDDFGELIHLADHGWSQEIEALREQLEKALKASPEKSVATTARALLDAIETGDVVIISDGTGPAS